MSYVGNKPAQKTIPVDDSVTTAMLKDDAVTSAKIDDGTITSTDMAVDPRNASNLNAGDVPLAQLDNVDTSGIVANQDDIALLGFKVAANGSLAKYNLVDQTIDAFEDASGVDASASTNETRNASNYYSGASSARATGGTETSYGAYYVNTFSTSADFVVGSSGNVDALVIAGGGAGGGCASTQNAGSGGGGAGGFRAMSTFAVTAQTYAITVGTGGTGDTGTGANGTNSVFSTITATGGGGGGGEAGPGTPGNDGGSGGGGMKQQTTAGTGGSGNTPSTSPSQGNDGGDGYQTGSPDGGAGGGGGGSVGAGQTSVGNTGGTGGADTTNDWQTGVSQEYAGGGGGGGRSDPGSGGGGGAGNGGRGWLDVANDGNNATDGFGSGGGGGARYASGNADGGDGGNGVVVIRYPTDEFESFSNMTLISNATTAVDGAPTTGDLVITYTDGVGTATVNTDIKAYVSRNGSAYTSAVTLVSQGTTGGHTILTANGVDLSGITTGTLMRWKIETLNQSASKETRVQAVSLGWS